MDWTADVENHPTMKDTTIFPTPILTWGLLIGTVLLLGASGPPTREEPDAVSLEWKQRITQTARKVFYSSYKNPFALKPVEIGNLASPPESVSSVTEPAGDVASATQNDATMSWLFSHRLLNPYRIPGSLLDREKMGDWDWRDRFRWFLKAGFLPGSSTASQGVDNKPGSATSSHRIHPGTETQ